jgi:hypothetical protein
MAALPTCERIARNYPARDAARSGPLNTDAQIGAIAESKGLTRMMTLTLDPKLCVVEDSVKYIRECFSKFRVTLYRRFGKSISYISVVELQKSGMAHLHVLIGIHIEQSWISQAWQAVGGGKIVDIRLVDVRRVNAYLAKYLTKDLLLSVPARKKRISTSRDIRMFAKTAASVWNWTGQPINKYFRRLTSQRNHIVADIREDDAGIASFTAVRFEPINGKSVESRDHADEIIFLGPYAEDK